MLKIVKYLELKNIIVNNKLDKSNFKIFLKVVLPLGKSALFVEG